MKKRYIIAFIITLGILWLTNPYWIIFKSKSHAHFEFYIFTIILICGYLLSLKITEYLADFKTLKNQSRIEIIFLTIFFGMLFIPMSHIDTKTVESESENRDLAVYKPLLEKNYKINYNFGNDFDKWFNDRFYYRKNLIYFYWSIKYNLSGDWLETKSAIYNKKTHWAFRKAQIISNNNFYTESFIKSVVKNINKLNNFCKTNNIKLYVLIIPHSNEIYFEQVPKYIHYDVIQKKKNLTVYKIQQKTSANVIYPYKELKQNSESKYVYFKQDHHWTDEGAYIGYVELMKQINKDFPQIKPVSLSDYNMHTSKETRSDWERIYASTGQRIKLDMPFLESRSNQINDVNYTYYDHKEKELLKIKTIYDNKERSKKYYFPYGADLNVIQIGTSMNENLNQFIPYTFKNLKYYRLNEVKDRNVSEEYKIMKYYRKEILNNKPDIIILVLTPMNLEKSNQWFEEK